MKKFKFGLLNLALILLFTFTTFAQSAPGMPDEGSGEYLDQVPIDGAPIFILVALGIGAFILLKKQKIAKQGEFK